MLLIKVTDTEMFLVIQQRRKEINFAQSNFNWLFGAPPAPGRVSSGDRMEPRSAWGVHMVTQPGLLSSSATTEHGGKGISCPEVRLRVPGDHDAGQPHACCYPVSQGGPLCGGLASKRVLEWSRQMPLARSVTAWLVDTALRAGTALVIALCRRHKNISCAHLASRRPG